MGNYRLKIIAHMYGDMWVEPFKRLERDGFIELEVIFTTIPGKISLFEKIFPCSLFVPDEKLRNSEIADLFNSKKVYVENITSLYQYLYKYDTLLFSMAKRNNSFNRLNNVIDYRINYYSIIDGITNMLKHINPDVIFFSEIPHNYGAYLLYLISGFLKIRCLIMTMPIELKGRIYVIEGIDRVNDRVLTEYLKVKEPDFKEFILPPALDELLSRMKGNYAHARPAYVKKYIQKGKTKFVSLAHINRMKSRKYLGTDLQNGVIHRILRRIEIFIWHKKLVKEYSALSKPVDITKKYIYFALHYQPEQTSLPMAGYFENQYMTLLLLSKNIPEGWNIYVKENPFQFLNLDLHQKNFKSKIFYKSISLLPGVKLIPMDNNSFELIDHSIAVATLTGMTGWEAIVRGKPVLCFGYSSYRICNGVFHINEEADLIDAIKKIEQNQGLPDQQKIKKYLSLVHENSSPGVLKDFEFDIYNINKDINDQSWYHEVLVKLKHDNN